MSGGAMAGKAACHTAVDEEGDECYKHVHWAKTEGIFINASWYPPSLTAASSFEDFQAFLHESDHAADCPMPCAAPALADVRVKLTTFNVYYADLGKQERTNGIGDAIAQLDADIAVITEQWNEKPHILARARNASGRNYKFCSGGPQEELWDGDILYDADLWANLKDGIKDLGANRGLSWALLKHKSSGKRLLIYGVHPVCCGHEDIHLQNALDFVEHLQGTQPEWPEVPVVLMGDFNALEDWSSTKLWKHGFAQAYGRYWQLPMSFVDTFREAPGNTWKDATTHNTNVRLDYIFTERRSPPAFQTVSASIWKGAPGGSDHYPISAELLLKR